MPCGRLEKERRAADERTGRNGSARIGSRPEGLTTKLQTIQRELQQGRPPRESTRAGDVERGRARFKKTVVLAVLLILGDLERERARFKNVRQKVKNRP